MGDSSLLVRALARIDAIHAEDPRSERDGEREGPQELLYSRRMSETLAWFSPDASEPLRLATRAQHLARWRIPRSDFPDGRDGYRDWRAHLLEVQAELAVEVLRDVGYPEETTGRVSALIRKEALKRDPEAQTLEDVACLVFLEHHFEEFAKGHDDEKLVGILRKTLAKMSPRGREVALEVELDSRGTKLVARALAR